MPLARINFALIFFFAFTACKTPEQQVNPYLQPEYWKKQALTDILPAWTNHLVDTVNRSFHSTLDENWEPLNDTVRFPSMIARHLFSYSVAYMMEGKEDHLAMARALKNYLLEHAWDKEYGGWYDALSPEGEATQRTKSTFVQVYVITGLALYYLVTHDEEVLQYIHESNGLLEQYAWDPIAGGYFDNLAQDWSRRNDIKSFSSQLAPVSGYLLYLYMATRKTDYLKQSERIMDTVLSKMSDTHTGWILESFDKDWNYLPGKQEENEINIGHNIEVAWSLLRLYRVNNRKDYLEKGKRLADSVHRYGFNPHSGIWYGGVGNTDPEQHTNYTHWWIQAYGNMLDLCMAKLYPQGGYLNTFSKGATFWEAHFMDKKRGDTHLTVMENGAVTNAQKANQFKASYHNMEHGLLNFLYLGSWVFPQPITLYFKISSGREGDLLYPMPIEILNVRVKNIMIDGREYTPLQASGEAVKLPELKDASVSVTVY